MLQLSSSGFRVSNKLSKATTARPVAAQNSFPDSDSLSVTDKKFQFDIYLCFLTLNIPSMLHLKHSFSARSLLVLSICLLGNPQQNLMHHQGIENKMIQVQLQIHRAFLVHYVAWKVFFLFSSLQV